MKNLSITKKSGRLYWVLQEGIYFTLLCWSGNEMQCVFHLWEFQLNYTNAIEFFSSVMIPWNAFIWNEKRVYFVDKKRKYFLMLDLINP